VAIVRDVARDPTFRRIVGEERAPGAGVDGEALVRWVTSTVAHYYHPTGSCRMGSPTDPGSVVDGQGRVHGLDGAWVGDLSTLPDIPATNTNLPAALVGEVVARQLVTG
jgi:choline dehydrogenase-like flavoprotein